LLKHARDFPRSPDRALDRSSAADAFHAAALPARLLALESGRVDDDTDSIDTANRFRRTT
jgi:hypothetical protein